MSVHGPLEVRGSHRKVAEVAAAGEQSRLSAGMVALSAATGVLVIAAADTAGRLGHASSPWAVRSYWAGQALILVPAAARLLRRRVLTEASTQAVVVVLTVAQYLVKVIYSPAGFTYSDELSHWRTAENILQAGRLFTPNYVLPISPRYPGLEAAASALVSVTGLSLFTCGLIVAGVAHVMFVCALYVLFRRVGGSHRIAGVAVLVYSSNPDLAYFDSIFAYQTLALAFLGLALVAMWHLGAADATRLRTGWLVVAVAASAATIATHHVTSYLLVAALALLALVSLAGGQRRLAAWAGLLALSSAIGAACWAAFVAPQTLTYLWPAAEGVVQGFHAVLTGSHAGAPSTSAAPLGNRALAAGGVLVLSALLPAGWWHVRRRHHGQPWAVAMAVGSVSWYAIVAVRLGVADGSELAGRAASFVFIPVAFVAALALTRIVDLALGWRAAAVAAAALTGILLTMFDGAVNGWPPYWERLPGPHQVAGAERSVGPEEIAVARWALRALGPGQRFAADIGNAPVLGGYGAQNLVLGVGFLYTSRTYTVSDLHQVQALDIQYILVDLRLSRSLPASGQYFPIDPEAGRYARPLPAAGLTKFSATAGVARVFDAGDIAIYDLDGGADAP